LLLRYQNEIETFLASLETFCTRQGIACALASTDVAFEDLVLRVLRHGAMIR